MACGYYKQGKYEEALPLFERALAIFERSLDPDHPNILICLKSLASTHYNLGNWAEAINCYSRVIKIDPVGYKSWYNKGASLANLGRYEEALTCFEKVLQIKPDYEPAHEAQRICLKYLRSR